MSRSNILFLWIIVMLIGIPFSKATHIVGGEITYECIGNDNYRISLVIFRDCDSGNPWFDDPASLGVFNNDGVLVTEVLMPLSSINDTLDLSLDDPCLVVPPNVCIHTTTYTRIVNLPFIVGGYELAYQRCCRNQDIVNIVSPLTTGATYSVKITDDALQACNNSPMFKEWPSVYICQNSPISFDHSAIDVEGDSIVYSLCTPFLGGGTNSQNPNGPNGAMPQPPSPPSYTPITWLGIFSEQNMMGGTDPLSIDPQTGLLTGTPTILGTFVVGVCAREYRNGVLLSEIRRDFQYVVGICSQINYSAFFAPIETCNKSLIVNFSNQSQTQFFDFQWDFGDGSTSSFTFPSHEYQDTGTYTVSLIVDPNSACADTSIQEIEVYLRGIEASVSDASFICQLDTTSFTADVQSEDLDSVTYTWSPQTGIIDGLGTDSITVYAEVDQEYILTVRNQYDCIDTAKAVLNTSLKTVNVEATANPREVLEGAVVQLGANITGSNFGVFIDPNLEYNWSSHPSITEDLNQAYLKAYPTEPTTYYVTIQNEYGCTSEDSVSVTLLDPPCARPLVFVPNTFTPNGDGLNDLLYVRGNIILEVNLVIYNRWGERIFEITNMEQAWDGTLRGKDLPPDVYGYYLRCRCDGGEEYIEKGNITLIR
ncbi:MAG: gliding motility-associated C-terminal domain-containing protein [Saprospiraceae bacterium]|nr:gliding motility-associated C-terminal domain-containing protein [Saprospiraceae bacterium]